MRTWGTEQKLRSSGTLEQGILYQGEKNLEERYE